MRNFVAAYRADLAQRSPEEAFRAGAWMGAAAAIWYVILVSPIFFWLGYKSTVQYPSFALLCSQIADYLR